MRAVIDTNVLLSGLLWRGTPHLLLERIRTGTLSLVSSPELIAELAGIVARAEVQYGARPLQHRSRANAG